MPLIEWNNTFTNYESISCELNAKYEMFAQKSFIRCFSLLNFSLNKNKLTFGQNL
jgi:hypothetical protein